MDDRQVGVVDMFVAVDRFLDLERAILSICFCVHLGEAFVVVFFVGMGSCRG